MRMIRLDFISKDRMEGKTVMEKVRTILGMVKEGSLVVVEGGLSPEEEKTLIETTMLEINTTDDFFGIELYSLGDERSVSRIKKILGINGERKSKLTVIGPSNVLEQIRKEPGMISLLAKSNQYQ
ncbi:DUF2073 domain-containing protein [Thermococci archaeon]|nr:MAG: DUF2073 domain-containing protein [Thermococci archaeon]